MKFIGQIYKIVCECGCKNIYIGSTKQRLQKRFNDHKGAAKSGSKKLFYIHMRDVGYDKFRIIRLEKKEFEDREELLQLEDKYIRECNTCENGFNCINAKRNTDEDKKKELEKRKKALVQLYDGKGKVKCNNFYIHMNKKTKQLVDEMGLVQPYFPELEIDREKMEQDLKRYSIKNDLFSYFSRRGYKVWKGECDYPTYKTSLNMNDNIVLLHSDNRNSPP